MALTTLISAEQSPTGRTLTLAVSTKTLIVTTACCEAELKQEGGAWLCRACDEIDCSALWASLVSLDADGLKHLPSGYWGQWLKFWFDLDDATLEVEWV